jgi:hypothetical protein
MKFLEQQGSGEHWRLKADIVGGVGSLLELLLHEEASCKACREGFFCVSDFPLNNGLFFLFTWGN